MVNKKSDIRFKISIEAIDNGFILDDSEFMTDATDNCLGHTNNTFFPDKESLIDALDHYLFSRTIKNGYECVQKYKDYGILHRANRTAFPLNHEEAQTEPENT